MALLPYIADLIRPRRPHDFTEYADLITDMIVDHSSPRYLRPWRNLSTLQRDIGSTIKSDKDKFQINLDVQHFSPDEISVKIVNNYIVVEGKHEEKKDEHGFISRQFKRRYAIPDGCKPETVESKLSSDGVLTILVPKMSEGKDERVVPITHTGPVRRKGQDEEIVENGPEEGKTPAKKKRR
ncbi:protein lethal(2)essential for life-like [Leptidea sinapis]|uniref:protein lethal(2)essential for life-like n=1 Tax=Leptidea sinapis TaxID=189913 RepID=UPI00213A088F|nr:protein lethal(2)essential for life-like [Leptidea sinapis]